MRDRRRPFDGWDPYGSMPEPPDDGRRGDRRWKRPLRIAFAGIVALLALSREIGEGWHALFGQRQEPAPIVAFDRTRIPDPRTELPRGAAPIGDMADWFTSDDYPAQAMRDGVAGTVAMHYIIGGDGHISQCGIAQSSGSALLDQTACTILRRRALYWPARDANGTAIPSEGSRRVRWQLPKS